MKKRTLGSIGVIGTVVAAVCCFTPLLVVILAALGLTALAVYLDYALFPSLAFFLGVTLYALLLKKGG
jgi:hypothetical protein